MDLLCLLIYIPKPCHLLMLELVPILNHSVSVLRFLSPKSKLWKYKILHKIKYIVYKIYAPVFSYLKWNKSEYFKLMHSLWSHTSYITYCNHHALSPPWVCRTSVPIMFDIICHFSFLRMWFLIFIILKFSEFKFFFL